MFFGGSSLAGAFGGILLAPYTTEEHNRMIMQVF